MIHDPAGIDQEKLAYVMDLKNARRGLVKDAWLDTPLSILMNVHNHRGVVVNPAVWSFGRGCHPRAKRGDGNLARVSGLDF